MRAENHPSETVNPAAALKEVLGSHRLPVFPNRHYRILEILRRDEHNPVPVVEAISTDPSVAIRVLRIANSAAFGTRRPIDNIHRAVVLLGRARLESLVLGLGFTSAVARHKKGPLDKYAFWSTATQRASISRELCDQLAPNSSALAFTAALVSDIAVPLLADARPRLYNDFLTSIRQDGVPLETLEQETFGWDHAEVASWLCMHWSLPARLALLLRNHHGAFVGDPAELGATQAAALAVGSTGVEPSTTERLQATTTACWHHLGIAPDITRRVLERPSSANDELTKMLA